MQKEYNGKVYEIKGLFISKNYHSSAFLEKGAPWALFWALAPGSGIPENYGSYTEAKKALGKAQKETGLPVLAAVC